MLRKKGMISLETMSWAIIGLITIGIIIAIFLGVTNPLK